MTSRKRKCCWSNLSESPSPDNELQTKCMRKSLYDCVHPNVDGELKSRSVQIPWLEKCRRTSPTYFSIQQHYLVTDASDIGWGAVLDNVSLCGEWSAAEKTLEGNEKELSAIIHVLRDHNQLLKFKTIHIQCDCCTVVTLVQREGGIKSTALKALYAVVRGVIDLHNIKLSIHHIPGIFNYHADNLSRKKILPEWHLLPQITMTVFKKWGTPTIDLFASSSAHVVPKYCTLNLNDTSAALYDAFSIKWHFPLAWVFPPPHLIPKVLAHMNNASGIYLLVAPRWEDMFWISELMNRALAPPLTIPNLSRVLMNTKTGKPPKRVKKITLDVWKCAGGNSI